MEQDNVQATEIRQFLLGQLPEARAAQIEERIFQDDDFADEVEGTEAELAAEYRAGALSSEERGLFEQLYLKSAAGRREVELDAALDEFVRAKLNDDNVAAGATVHAPAAVLPPHAPTPGVRAEVTRATRAKDFTTDFWPNVGAHLSPPMLAVAAGLLLLLAVGFTYFITRPPGRPPLPEAALAARRSAEAELARLNRGATEPPRGGDVLTVDLKPLQRGGGEQMPRVPAGLAQGRLLVLRLSVGQAIKADYRAVFLDDRRRELFAVSNLSARETPDGPQVWVVVPAKYFGRGDYQIDLNVDKGGGYEVNSYAFRVNEDG
jgi:anti-sigma-K factor RskA